MFQQITIQQWNETPSNVQSYITSWKRNKGYPQESPLLTLGQCIELLIGVSRRFHQDYSDGRTLNNILTLNEAVIAWDGEELIDTLYYEIVTILKRRLAQTYNAPA